MKLKFLAIFIFFLFTVISFSNATTTLVWNDSLIPHQQIVTINSTYGVYPNYYINGSFLSGLPLIWGRNTDGGSVTFDAGYYYGQGFGFYPPNSGYTYKLKWNVTGDFYLNDNSIFQWVQINYEDHINITLINENSDYVTITRQDTSNNTHACSIGNFKSSAYFPATISLETVNFTYNIFYDYCPNLIKTFFNSSLKTIEITWRKGTDGSNTHPVPDFGQFKIYSDNISTLTPPVINIDDYYLNGISLVTFYTNTDDGGVPAYPYNQQFGLHHLAIQNKTFTSPPPPPFGTFPFVTVFNISEEDYFNERKVNVTYQNFWSYNTPASFGYLWLSINDYDEGINEYDNAWFNTNSTTPSFKSNITVNGGSLGNFFTIYSFINTTKMYGEENIAFINQKIKADTQIDIGVFYNNSLNAVGENLSIGEINFLNVSIINKNTGQIIPVAVYLYPQTDYSGLNSLYWEDIFSKYVNCQLYKLKPEDISIPKGLTSFTFNLSLINNCETYIPILSPPDENISSPNTNNTPPANATIKFQERFSSGWTFDVDYVGCLEAGNGFYDAQFQSHTPKYSYGDHDWACWFNSSIIFPEFHYENEFNTDFISTEEGIKHTVYGNNVQLTSWATSGNDSIDMSHGNTDYFMFTCDTQNQTHSNSYILMGKNNGIGVAQDYAMYLSLTNGGCAYNLSLAYQDGVDKIPCCELNSIIGNDCSGGKTFVNFTEQDIEDQCMNTDVGDLSVSDIDRVEFMTLKRTAGGDTVYFDDFYLYSVGTMAGNDTLPVIYTMDGTPDPQNVNVTVTYYVGMYDVDSNTSSVYSGFDCDSDGHMEYNWSAYGLTPTFNCVYDTIGVKTAHTYAVNKLPYVGGDPYASMTATTTIVILNETETPETGGSCTGYVAQTCTGTCYFIDNFNYDKPISCAGWGGTAQSFHPTLNVIGIYGTNASTIDYTLDKGSSNSIKSSAVSSFETKFDLRLNTNDIYDLRIYDDNIDKLNLYLWANNYNLVAFKSGGSLTLGTLTPNTWYNIKAVVNYNTSYVYYYIDNILVGTINLYDSDVTSARKWIMGWQDVDASFDVDNFQVNILAGAVSNVTVTPTVDYVYNGDLFCAINWTNPNTDKFSVQNCADRGFPTEYPLLSLCIPRACIQDIGLSAMDWATSNIFRTIIIVTAFILLAPLLVVLIKKR